LKINKKKKKMSVFGEIELGMSRAVSDDEDDEFAIKQE